MRKLIFTAIILLMASCSGGEEIEIDCGCYEVQERLISIRNTIWPTSSWEETGVKNNLEDCYTNEEIPFLIREVGNRERWFIMCTNN